MIHVLGKLPSKCYVAVSGGADSMAVLEFLRAKQEREVTVLHFDHGTEFGKKAKALVHKYCWENDIDIVNGEYKGRQRSSNREEFWRDLRYSFFAEHTDHVLIQGHHLGDLVETYLFRTLHGHPHPFINYYRDPNIIRPFLTTTRDSLRSRCSNHEVPFLDDPSNEDRAYMRSIIRHDMLDVVAKVNPGFERIVKRKFLEAWGDVGFVK